MATELSVKRLYLPGQSLMSVCPECDERVVVDLGEDYLSYPMLGAPSVLTMCCACGGERDVWYELTVSVRVVTGPD